MSHFGVKSVRFRLAAWIAAVLLFALAPLTAATIAVERGLVLDLQSATGESLVAHLASMPEFHASLATARQHIEGLARALSATGATLEIVPPAAAPGAGMVAERRLDLDAGPYLLRYRADAPWLSRLVGRAVALHVLVGAMALTVLLAGAQWIVRTRLVAPLGRIAHQVRFMGRGGGWTPELPEADAELGEVQRAISDLGPALQAQVGQWIEGERRAAMAATLAGVRARLHGPQSRALALAGDLQARGAVIPGARGRLRALVLEIERLSQAIGDLERETFALTPVTVARPEPVPHTKGRS